MPEGGGETPQPESEASAASGDPLVGIDVAGYVVLRRIAAGGMGLVYEARHPTIGRRAAVKVLRPEVAADQGWAARFLVEARAIAALSHRNIVEILNFGQLADGRQYLMMAYLEGEPLDVTIRRRAPMAPREALALMEQIFNALAEAHKKGVLHRDLKPHNVMVLTEHSGELLLKLLDFGLARQGGLQLDLDGASHEETARGGALPSLRAGTPEYLAPEQALGQPVGPAADLYAAGVILFQMLTGALPFQSASALELLRLHARTPPPSLASLGARASPELEAFVAALLAKSPAHRPASADTARARVRELLRTEARAHTGSVADTVGSAQRPSAGAGATVVLPREARTPSREGTPAMEHPVERVGGSSAHLARGRRRTVVLLTTPALVAGLGAAALGVLTREPPATSTLAPVAAPAVGHAEPAVRQAETAEAPRPTVRPDALEGEAPAGGDPAARDSAPELTPRHTAGAPAAPAGGRAASATAVGTSRGPAGAPRALVAPATTPTEERSLPRSACVPNDAWRLGARQALSELQASASRSPELFERLLDDVEELSRLVQAAATQADCALVDQRLQGLRRAVHATEPPLER